MIGEKLKEIREQTGLNKKDFASHIGIKYTTYNNYETGDREPSSDFLIMISQKLQDAINAQIVAEMWSANLYLSMSYFFAAKGYEGFASWMKAQAHEESDHADVLAQYVMKRGGQAKVGAVDAVPQEWASPLDVFEHVYKHECHVSELIDKLVDVASAEKDKASQDFLWGFVREQVEEEATVQGILDKIKLGGDVALYHLDIQLGARK